MFIFNVLLAILGISVLVIVHEGGHYLAARAFKMRVLRYSIGFGPTLFKYKPKNSPTTFQVGAIPFLAYVQIAGMNPHEEVDPDDPEIYPNKGVFARIVTIAAGPVANYLIASVIVFGLGISGWFVEDVKLLGPMTVAEVEEGSPASEAGVQADDVIVEANGKDIDNVRELIDVTSPRANEPTEYVVERDGERLEPITITPQEKEGRGLIGVRAKTTKMEYVYADMSVGDALGASVTYPAELTALQIAGIAQMFRSCTFDDVAGPVRMGKIVAEQAERGVPHYLRILMILSVALGLFNLLPFPALDGGRLVFLGYELVTRRRPNERFEATVHVVGLLFLLSVLVLVTFREVASF